MVRYLADTQQLNGAALLEDGEVAGYGYNGLECHKAVIADLYVRARWRGTSAESALLRALLDALIAVPQVRHIESQLMLC